MRRLLADGLTGVLPKTAWRLALAVAVVQVSAGCVPEIERPLIDAPLPPEAKLAGPWVEMRVGGAGGAKVWLDIGPAFAGEDETAVLLVRESGHEGAQRLAVHTFRIRRVALGGRTWFEAESLGPDDFPDARWKPPLRRFFGRYEITSNGQLRIVIPSLADLRTALEEGRLQGMAGGAYQSRLMLQGEPAALRAFLAATPPQDGEALTFARVSMQPSQ